MVTMMIIKHKSISIENGKHMRGQLEQEHLVIIRGLLQRIWYI